MKNKIILFIFLVGIGLSAQNYSKGSHRISAGMGSIFLAESYSNNPIYRKDGDITILVESMRYLYALNHFIFYSYEYGLFEKVSIGLTNTLGNYVFGLRGLYYIFQMDKIDTYVGTFLGMAYYRPSFGVLAGAQYFFANNMAVNVELSPLSRRSKEDTWLLAPSVSVGLSASF